MGTFERVCRWERGDIVLEYGESGSADAPVLLLLHAIRNTKMLFAGIVPELAKRFRVIAVDLRGHGGSIQEGPYTFEQVAEDLAVWLADLRIKRLTVVAASFSAVPAQMIALRIPEKISGLVLLDGGYFRLGDVPGFSLEKTVDRLAAARFASVAEAEGQFMERYGEGGLPAGWMAGELAETEDGRYRYTLPREAFAGYFHAYSTFGQEKLFAELSCPVLLLLADERHVPEEQRPFYRQAAAVFRERVKDVRVAVISASQHLLMVTNPQETMEAIVCFLQARKAD